MSSNNLTNILRRKLEKDKLAYERKKALEDKKKEAYAVALANLVTVYEKTKEKNLRQLDKGVKEQLLPRVKDKIENLEEQKDPTICKGRLKVSIELCDITRYRITPQLVKAFIATQKLEPEGLDTDLNQQIASYMTRSPREDDNPMEDEDVWNVYEDAIFNWMLENNHVLCCERVFDALGFTCRSNLSAENSAFIYLKDCNCKACTGIN